MSSKTNKWVIYTCITGSYDGLIKSMPTDSDFDYICFSDDILPEQAGIWQIRPIPCNIEDPVRRSRYVKLLPHKAVPEYEYSLWIDANIEIIDERFYEIVKHMIGKDIQIANVPHPERDCIYDELLTCLYCYKTTLFQAVRTHHHLRKLGFPRHYGLFENNIILRKHSDSQIIAIDEDWWTTFNRFSKRDQHCYMFVLWKHGIMPALLFGEGKNARNVEFVKCVDHAKPWPYGHTFKEKVINHLSRYTYRLLCR